MRIVVIGGTGHVGTYMVPQLVEEGYEVISISRNMGKPYQAQKAWNSVKQIMLDRVTLEKEGRFGKEIRDLKPDVVIDMICFTPDSASQLVEALKGQISHFLHCGSLWVHGYSVQVPTHESQVRSPFGKYGINKAAIEDYLLNQARQYGFPATILHPGHIVGPGWLPINPVGNLNVEVYRKLAKGHQLLLPNIGMETLHHVHADDVAQAFIKTIGNWSQAVGESFHVASSGALTMRGYAEKIASWFGQRAHLSYLPWEEWKTTVSKEDAEITWDHLAHSPCFSIEKACDLLNYRPIYTSIQAIKESLSWQVTHNKTFIDS